VLISKYCKKYILLGFRAFKSVSSFSKPVLICSRGSRGSRSIFLGFLGIDKYFKLVREYSKMGWGFFKISKSWGLF
jgi:hypothetical protein